MHDIDTTRLESEPLSLRQEIEASEFEFLDAGELESPLSEVEEMELASELLAVSSEAELDQFLGDVFKKALKGIRKVGSSGGGLGGVLKGIAKKALPFVGGALGSIIPIPGVGTAVGTALGSAASKVIKAELEGLSLEDREFEMARRFVRFAGTAAKSAASTPPGATARAGIIAALRSRSRTTARPTRGQQSGVRPQRRIRVRRDRGAEGTRRAARCSDGRRALSQRPLDSPWRQNHSARSLGMELLSPASLFLDQEARALLTRLERVKPFSLQMTSVLAAAVSPGAQTAIESYLAKGRCALRELVLEVYPLAPHRRWPGRRAGCRAKPLHDPPPALQRHALAVRHLRRRTRATQRA